MPTKTKAYFTMKIKLTTEQIKAIVANPEAAAEAKINVTDPWWIIVLKVVKYICELVLAGAAGFLAVSCGREAVTALGMA